MLNYSTSDVIYVRIINPQYLPTQTLFHLFCLIFLVHESHHVQVVNCLSIEVKLAIFDSCSTWESLRNQICFIPGLLGALLLFLLYCLLFQCFKAHRKARLGEVNLFFAPFILHSFLHVKACMICHFTTHQLAHVPLPIREPHDRFGISFLHLWGICLFWVSLLYARFGCFLMHSICSCILYIQQPMILQGWLLYTQLI